MGQGELMGNLPQMTELVRATQDRVLSERARDGVAERVVRARATRLRRAHGRRRRVVRFGSAAAACVLAASVLLLLRLRPDAPGLLALSFAIGGQPGVLGAFVATTEARAVLQFSDGSDVDLAPSSALRVADLSASGADVVLERGTLRTHVVPRAGNRWTVAAGPFRVAVKGTRFDTTWDPGTSTLRVAMAEGRVLVTGACLGEGRELHAGDVAEVNCTVAATPASIAVDALPTAAADPTTQPPAHPKHDERAASSNKAATHVAPASEAAEHASTAAPSPTPTWRELARSGRLPEALDRAPIETILATALAGELMLLAETARRAGQSDLAERGYSGVRRRFGGAPEAEQATFLLGRLLAEQGRTADADALFGEYARRAPSGVFAEEAAGRLLERAVVRGDRPRTRDLAKSYLERFPRGASADLARSLLLP